MNKQSRFLAVLSAALLGASSVLASVRGEAVAMADWAVGDVELVLDHPQRALTFNAQGRISFSDGWDSGAGDFAPRGAGLGQKRKPEGSSAMGMAYGYGRGISGADWASLLNVGPNSAAPALPLNGLEELETPASAFHLWYAKKLGSLDAGLILGYGSTRNDRTILDDVTGKDDRGNRSQVLSLALGLGKEELLGFKRLDLAFQLDLPGAFTSAIVENSAGQHLIYEVGEMSGAMGLELEILGFRPEPFGGEHDLGLRLSLSTFSFNFSQEEQVAGDWTEWSVGTQALALDTIWKREIKPGVFMYGLAGLSLSGALYEAKSGNGSDVLDQASQSPNRISVSAAAGLEAEVKSWLTVRAGLKGEAWALSGDEALSGVDLSSTLGSASWNDPAEFSFTTGLGIRIGDLVLNTQVDQAAYQARIGKGRLPYAKLEVGCEF